MARIEAKYLRTGTNPGDVNAQAIPADYTPVNYVPEEVSTEGSAQISSHLKGIDEVLGEIINENQQQAVDILTLNSGDISAQQVTLSQTPTTPSDVILNVVGGPEQEFGVDYTVTDNVLSWNGFTLAGILVSGDTLIVQYLYGGGGISAGTTWHKENFTLSSGDITNQYVDLAFQAAEGSMSFNYDGLIQFEGDDYTLSTVGGVTRVTLAGSLATGGDSALVSGDKIYIQYQY